MNYSQVASGSDARQKILKGIKTVAEPVISTLGPRSRNVALHFGKGAATIHDGVTIAQSIRLRNQLEDLGILLIRQAAIKTNTLAGDGTTTATLLAYKMVEIGLMLVEGNKDRKVITSKRTNPMELHDAILQYSKIIQDKLESMKKVVNLDSLELKQIATISSASEELGSMISTAWSKIGRDGAVLVEESGEDGVELREGYEFDNGWLSPFFMTDTARYITKYEDAYILIVDSIIEQVDDITPIITQIFESDDKKVKKPLLILAHDIKGPAMEALKQTRLQLGYEIVAVMAPEWADLRHEMLDDISILTGGVLASPDVLPLKSVELKHLGRIRNLLITQFSTAFTPSNPDKEELDDRVNEIKNQIAQETNDFRIDRLKMRIAKLCQAVAIIKVSGNSESELKDKRERVIDAVFATKAAIMDGVIIGGGRALSLIADDLEALTTDLLPESRELVVSVLQAPFRQLLINSGIDPEKYLSLKKDEGVDVMSKKVVNMYEVGILDPVKVTKLAVLHAFSIAADILTTEFAVSDEDPKDENNHA